MKHLHNIMELIALLVAIFYYPYLKNSYMKWFLPFLAFVFVAEVIGFYAGRNSMTHAFYIIVYTLNYALGIVQSIFYGYIFYQFSESRLLRKIIYILVPIGVLMSLYGFFFSGKWPISLIYSWIMFGAFTAIIALGYIYTEFTSDNASFGIAEPGFWVAVGVSLFFSGTSIVFSLYDFILKNNLNILGMRLYNFVPRVLCIVLYSCISIAIILCKKKSKESNKVIRTV